MDLSDLYEMLVLVWKMMIQMIQDLEVPFETTPVFKHQTQPLLNSEVSLSPLSFGFTEFCFGLCALKGRQFPLQRGSRVSLAAS